eukprot:1191917-Prorocentrum_minimum.AAC.9
MSCDVNPQMAPITRARTQQTPRTPTAAKKPTMRAQHKLVPAKSKHGVLYDFVAKRRKTETFAPKDGFVLGFATLTQSTTPSLETYAGKKVERRVSHAQKAEQHASIVHSVSSYVVSQDGLRWLDFSEEHLISGSRKKYALASFYSLVREEI